MAALGRILQIVGWLWLIVGFFGPMFGLLSLNLLPGIILVFVARVIRKQAERTEMPELGEPAPDEEPETVVRQSATRQRETRDERPRRAPPEPYVVAAPEKPQSPPEREQPTSQEMLERVVGVRDESRSRDEMPAMPGEALDEESRKPMSSAEMIARAHERWDSKPH